MNQLAMKQDDEFADVVGRLLRERRSIHVFESRSVPDSIVLDALDAARWAPNHHHTEPWQFRWLGPETAAAVVDLNTELVRAAKGDAAAENKRERWSSVPGWIGVINERNADPLRQREDYAACCCAIHNLALALWAHGVGMKWTTGPVTRDPRFFDLMQCDPERHEIVGLCWYGYPTAIPEQRRKPLDECLRRLP